MPSSSKPWIFVVAAACGWLAITQDAAAADPQTLHLLNRLSFGPRPGDVEHVEKMGRRAYLRQQLDPKSIVEPQTLTAQLNALQTLQLTTLNLMEAVNTSLKNMEGLSPQERNKQQRPTAYTAFEQAVQSRLLRALHSNQQFQEVMVEFWFNHFNVFSGKGKVRFLVGSYEQEAIRPHALGRFRDLLGATAKHPAMLFYLDNWRNSSPSGLGRNGQGLNENYARELMELHTLGVDGGYRQQDVGTLAKILTGWTFRESKQPGVASTGFYFDPRRHDFSDKVFLGQPIPGSGVAEGETALDILARSPATARHISYKLAQYFVADQPPKTLVNKLTRTFLASDGNIRAVLSTLFESSEFNAPQYYEAKFKTPYQYVISAVRATGQPVSHVGHLFGHLQQLGMPLYGCASPDGYKNTQDAWLNPDAMTRRLNFATILAMGQLPLIQSELPIQPAQFPSTLMPSVAGGANTKADRRNLRVQVGIKVDPDQLAATLGNAFSPRTQQVIASSSPRLRAALMLGSPDFMQR